MLRRTLPWLGLTLLVAVAGGGLWTLYIHSIRIVLDQGNRRELAHAASELQVLYSQQAEALRTYVGGGASDTETFIERNPYVMRGKPGKPGLPVCVTPTMLRADKLELPFDPEAVLADIEIAESFEYVFIAEAGEKAAPVVLGVENMTGLRRGDASGWVAARARQSPGFERSEIRLTDLTGLKTLDGKTLSIASIEHSSGNQPVLFGSKEYQLFTYPIPGDKVASCDKRNWIAGGLVDLAGSRQEAMALRPRGTALLILGLILFLSAYPTAKVLLLHPSERFTLADGWAIFPSASFLLMAGAVFLLEQGAMHRAETAEDLRLQSLARNVEGQMTASFIQMRDGLRAVETATGSADEAVCGLNGGPIIHQYLERCPVADRAKLYPWFSQAIWMTAKGRQYFKVVAAEKTTPLITLADRAYFRQARDGYLWSLEGETSGQPFLVEVIRSKLTNQMLTALSVKGVPSDHVVAAFAAYPVWQHEPFLPPGYQFAVVAGDGEVLYHSNGSRALRENLIAQVSDPSLLEAAFHARRPASLSTHYRNRSVKIHLEPVTKLKGPGWWVVTLRDRAWLDGLSTEALIRTMIWLFIPSLGPAFIALAALVEGRKSLRFWWPNPEWSGLYRTLAACYALVLATGIAITAVFNPASGLYLAFATCFPILILATTFTVYKNRARFLQTAAGTDYGSWYLLAMAGLWVTTALPPAIGVFRHNWQIENAKLATLDAKRAAIDRIDWEAKDRYANREVPPESRAATLKARLDARPSYHTPYPVSKTIDDSPGGWMNAVLPVYSDTVAQTRMQAPADFGQVPWLPGPNSFGWLIAAGFAALLAAAWLWLRYNIQNVFWIGHVRPSACGLPSFTDQYRFFILIAPSSMERFHLAARLLSGDQPLAEVVLDIERVRISDEARLNALTELENAVQNKKRVAVLASTDPADFALELPSAGGSVTVQPAERERWMRLFEPFVWRNMSVTGVTGAPEIRYASIWRHCSPEEQLTLMQVEREGFANPHQRAAVERLVEKGLLIFDPQLQLMEPGFAKFVRGRAAGTNLAELEKPRQSLGWRGTRPILLGALMAVLVVLGITHGSWFTGIAAGVAAVTGALEGTGRILRAIQDFRNFKTS